jgi:cyclohexanecarboxyl-CoA dehydrogenase
MLDFTFTEEQNMIRTMVRDFAQKELAPGLKDRVEAKAFPRELLKKMADIGLMGLYIPEEYGGEPRDMVTIGIIMEELARCAGDAAIHVFNSFAQSCFIILASDKVKKEWLPAMARGEKTVSMAATEAEAGSDLGNLKTIARRDGDYYVINGEKNRVSFGQQADAATLLAKTDPASRRITPFLVPFELPGVSVAGINDMGAESTPGSIVSFEDVRLHKEYMLGDEEGKGFAETMRTFDCNRALLAIMAMAKAEVSVEETCEYVKQRVQFGKPIGKFEGISFKLAEAATYIELGRWLCYRTLWMKDNGMRHTKESAMVKWWCTRTAFDIIHECLLTHGHYGYSKDLPFEQRLRDVAGEEIGDGAPEVMKLIIVRDILGREFLPY